MSETIKERGRERGKKKGERGGDWGLCIWVDRNVLQIQYIKERESLCQAYEHNILDLQHLNVR